MDLYSTEKTKDYIFFKFISWYYQLTPKMIRIIKCCIGLTLVITCILIRIFATERLPLIIYCIICLNIIYVIYVLESLIKNLAKGTGNERMLEVNDAIKESMECFIKFSFKGVVKVFLFGNILYGVLLFFSKQKHQKQLASLLDNRLLIVYDILSASLGIFSSSASIYFSLWLSVIANIRASSHSVHCYNEYLRFTYSTSLTMSILSSALNIITLGVMILLFYLSMYLGDNDYYAYPYEKCGFLLVPYLFGYALTNIVVTTSGCVYSKTAYNCVRLMNRNIAFEENKNDWFINNYRNPIIIAEIIGENMKNIALSSNIIIILLYQLVIVMFITSSINDKMALNQNSIKRSMIVFPLLMESIMSGFELMRFCFIKTKSGFPQGGTDYQTAESPLIVLGKGSYCFIVLKIIVFFFISFFLFSSKQLYEIQTDLFWLYNFLCIIIGMITTMLLQYFTTIYTDSSYPSIKHIVSMTQEGYLGNILGGITNGVESAVFPCLLISITFVGTYNLSNRSTSSFQNIDSIHSQLGLYYTSVTLLGMLHQALFDISINHTKSISYNTLMLIKAANYDIAIQNIASRIPFECGIYQSNTRSTLSSIVFITSFILINSLGYIYSNLNLYEFKIDISQPEILISGFIGIIIIIYVASVIIDTIEKTTQISIKEMASIFSANNDSILVERTKIDYQQCVGLITQVCLKELYKLMTIVIIAPLLVSHTFKFVGYFQKAYFIGIQSLIAFNLFSLCTCVIMDVINNNSGSAWENTKYYIKTGAINSLGLDTLKFSTLGDSLGMIMKDVLGIVMNQIMLLLITFGMLLSPFI